MHEYQHSSDVSKLSSANTFLDLTQRLLLCISTSIIDSSWSLSKWYVTESREGQSNTELNSPLTIQLLFKKKINPLCFFITESILTDLVAPEVSLPPAFSLKAHLLFLIKMLTLCHSLSRIHQPEVSKTSLLK